MVHLLQHCAMHLSQSPSSWLCSQSIVFLRVTPCSWHLQIPQNSTALSVLPLCFRYCPLRGDVSWLSRLFEIWVEVFLIPQLLHFACLYNHLYVDDGVICCQLKQYLHPLELWIKQSLTQPYPFSISTC